MIQQFDDDFNFSTTDAAHALVRRACHRLIPDCIGVARASEADDRRGVDYWIATCHGRRSLDLKLRRKDFGARNGGSLDCVIELECSGNSGWLLKAGCADLILFAAADTRRVALFDARQLRIAVLLNATRWLANGQAREIVPTSERDGRRWSSRAIIVSADLLAAAIDALDDENLAANDPGAP